MVCAKCKITLSVVPIVDGQEYIRRADGIWDAGEKKLGKVIVPDKWKEGASNTNESGGRKINENKLLSKKNRWTPYGNTKCIICKQQVHQDAKYCHTCAYSKGVCAMCGKQVLDTKLYKQSNV
ncbi:Cysteine-rich PDZ-binding protein [Zea mays]|uniref:Cysteine-rich PDZ-binding protein n=2 Tax=Zea mays TaxID=4577 RepID=A0A3L6EZJ0_MAIZE|nr:hypothetical protein Zm00014a_009461 [Zea mays]PWZ26245.1 Cysteine-rich PDZ-binding protein [Zea mays]